ncbi:MAG TPA: HD domain-containing phosphohydrolase [bacterium]
MKLASKIYILVTGTVAVFTLLIAVGAGYVSIRQAYNSVEKRGQIMSKNLAHNSQFGVLFSDQESLIPLIEGMMLESDLLYARVMDRKGFVIAEKSRAMGGEPLKEFIAPIIIDTLSPYQEELELFKLAPNGKENIPIGKVYIAMSLKTVIKETRNFILILLTIIIVTALISYLGLALILRSVFVQPIQQLENASRKIASGNLNFKISMTSNDELGSLAAAINKMTEDLREKTVSKEYMDNIFMSTTISLIVTDTRGKMRTVNKATEEMLGYKTEELIGSPISMIVGDEAIHRWSVVSNFKGVDVIRNVEGIYLNKSKTAIPVLFASALMKDGNQQVIGLVCSARDITERKQTEEELKRNYVKMQKMMSQTVVSLASAVEMRDPYTAGHQRRVGQLATALAKEMKLSDDDVQGINMAALIHDIGKLQVPAEILSRPSALSDHEYNLVKLHSVMGYEILKSIDFPWPVAEIIYQHHERLNGSGYPRGLKGDVILPQAKVLIVADVVEAMISHRPYRPAKSIKDALNEITKYKGMLYEPVVVDACVVLFKEKGLKLD